MTVSLYFLIGFLIILFEYSRKKSYSYDTTFFFNVYFFICYCIVPICIFFGGSDYLDNKLYKSLDYFYKSYVAWYCLLALVSFFCGYFIFGNIYFKRNTSLSFKLKFTERHIIYFLFFNISFLIFIIYLYSSQFGGLIDSIILAKSIRNGEFVGNKFSFLKRFFSLSLISLYFSYTFLVTSPSPSRRKVFKFIFLLSIALVICVGLLNASRGFIIISLLGIYFIKCLQDKKIYFTQLAISGLFGMFIIYMGNALLLSLPKLIAADWPTFLNSVDYYMSHNSRNIFMSILSNFSHPVMSIGVAHESVFSSNESIRFFSDFVYAIFSLVPSFLLNIQTPETIAYLNTYNHLGVYESIIPPGLVAFGLYSFGPPGIVIYGLFLGASSATLNRFFGGILSHSKNASVFVYVFSYSFGLFVFNSEPRVMLQSIFTYILVLLLFIPFFKIVRVKI